MADEPDSLILRMLREIREQMATKDDLQRFLSKDDFSQTERQLHADVASDMLLMRKDLSDQIAAVRKDLSEQIVGLRRAVVEFHSSVVGHGVLIGEHDERLARVEKRLSLPPH